MEILAAFATAVVAVINLLNKTEAIAGGVQ